MILAIGLVKDHSVSYHARTMMRHTAIGIYSTGKIMLDGVVSAPEDSAKVPSVVLCHPHPMLGGDMNNVIVSTIASEVSQRGMVAFVSISAELVKVKVNSQTQREYPKI